MRRSGSSARRSILLPTLLVLLIVGCGYSVCTAGENPALRVLRDIDTGELKLRAEAGDAAAQELYAGRLQNAQFHAEAVKWLRRAAESERPEAQFRLGLLLLHGRPQMDVTRPAVPAQPGAGIKWLQAAANQNHAAAQLQLGLCHREGIGVSPNPVEACKWLMLAAEHLAAARRELDRTALTLTADQLSRAQAQAKAFRAGDRRDPRIHIVTQSDLESAASNPPDVVPQASAPDALILGNVDPTEVAAGAPAEPVATMATQPAVSPPVHRETGADPFAEIQQLIVRLVAMGVAGVLGLLALAFKLTRWLLRNRKPTRSPITGGPLPPALPAPRS